MDKVNSNIEYIKHNKVRLKKDSQKEITKIFKEFFNSIQGTVKGLRGYAILENIEDDKVTVVLTFWETKEDMENYYSKNNSILASLVEKVKPMLEQIPERSDYKIALIEID